MTTIVRGGFPELWRQSGMSSTEFYSSYLATYLERDVRQLLNVVSLRVLLEPYFANIAKRAVKSPKVYFADSGLLCFLLNLDESSLAKSSYLGDFVIDSGAKLTFVEAKWTEHPDLGDAKNILSVDHDLRGAKMADTAGQHSILCRSAIDFPVTPQVRAVPYKQLSSLFH